MNQNSFTCKNVDPWKSRAAASCLDLWNWLLDHCEQVLGSLEGCPGAAGEFAVLAVC